MNMGAGGEIVLRGWQKEALTIWQRRRSGIAKVVTGAGKTVFGISCFKLLRKEMASARLLIVVPSLALVDQWTENIARQLQIDPGDVVIHSGSSGHPIGLGLVHIAVVNTARSLTQELTSAGDWMLLVDECHRAASPSNRHAMNGRFVATLGLSATPERQYDEFFEEVLVPHLGEIIYEYSYADALRDGVLVPVELTHLRVPLTEDEAATVDELSRRVARLISSGLSFEDDAVKRVLLRRARVSQGARSRIPTAIHLLGERRRLRGFVFHESVELAELLASELAQRDHRVATYHSRMSAPARLRALRMFRTRQIDLLVACRALDEGLDVPGAELGVIVASTSSQRQRIQRTGRVLRPAPGKSTAELITFYALDSERDLLEEEAAKLEGLAQVHWFRAQLS